MSDALYLSEEIREEERILSECVACLEAKAPLSEWPEKVRTAFLGALAEDTVASERECHKAYVMGRHLFRGRPGPAPSPKHARWTVAERIRADLMGIVRLGAGTYLTNRIALR